MIDNKLIEKYNKALPRYTSYPPATSFHNEFTSDDYIKSIKASNNQGTKNISLYLHIPFCPRLCLYCGCTTLITRKEEMIKSYLEALKKEIGMLSQWIDLSRPVTQIHWGGGTPNALSAEQIGEIMGLISSLFKIEKNCEIAIECNPAHLTLSYLRSLFDMGFNRISLGIQDFNQKVLEAAHRDTSKLPIEELSNYIRMHSAGMNYDFIYGLPHQSPASFSETIKQALALKPDRIVTFSYAHVPWVKPHQSLLEKEGLPGAEEKMAMFKSAYDIITKSGEYDAIGLDHFSRKDDSLSIALCSGKLHRNFQGYCTRETTGQVYAFGMSAISQLYNSYAQNDKNIENYIRMINSGKPATVKGYCISEDEMIIKEVIEGLMCNNKLIWSDLAEQLETSVDRIKAVCGYSPKKMQQYIDDGLLIMDDNSLNITGPGRFTIRNIVAELDPKLNSSDKQFSKSI